MKTCGCTHEASEHERESGPCNARHEDGTHCLCYQFHAPVPQAVLDAIRTRYGVEQGEEPGTLERILRELRYSPLNGCWFFTHAGMVHGVEPDGYIHT